MIGDRRPNITMHDVYVEEGQNALLGTTQLKETVQVGDAGCTGQTRLLLTDKIRSVARVEAQGDE